MQLILDIIQDYKFLLGLFFCVPLSIVANLLTPKVENLLSGHSKRIQQKRIKKLRQEFEQVKNYAQNRSLLIEYLLEFIIKAIVLGFWCIFVGFLFYQLPVINAWAELFSRLFILLSSIIIVNLGLNTLDVYRKVKNFNDYEASVRKILQD